MGKLLPAVGIEGRLSSLKQVLEPVDYLAEEIGEVGSRVVLAYDRVGQESVGSAFKRFDHCKQNRNAGSCIIGLFSRFEEAEECIEVAVYCFVEYCAFNLCNVARIVGGAAISKNRTHGKERIEKVVCLSGGVAGEAGGGNADTVKDIINSVYRCGESRVPIGAFFNAEGERYIGNVRTGFFIDRSDYIVDLAGNELFKYELSVFCRTVNSFFISC